MSNTEPEAQRRFVESFFFDRPIDDDPAVQAVWRAAHELSKRRSEMVNRLLDGVLRLWNGGPMPDPHIVVHHWECVKTNHPESGVTMWEDYGLKGERPVFRVVDRSTSFEIVPFRDWVMKLL